MTIRRICRIILVAWVLVALALVVLHLNRDAMEDERSDEAPAVAETTVPPTVWQTTNLPPPLTEPAEVTAPAPVVARGPQIQVTEPPVPVFDPVAYVNGLEYRAVVPEPAMEAYRVVAAYYGWSEQTIEARAKFVYQIMGHESAFCWNARRWTYFNAGALCTDHKTGVHDDVGFGQITNVLRPLTCEKAGICSIADTVASPWNSMLAFVVVIDELKSRPWCYKDSRGVPNMHMRNGDCATWPG